MSQFFALGGQSIGVSASTSVLPMNISFRMDWLDLLAVQGTLKSLSWRRKWQPTPVFLPGESHRQRSLVGYSPCGRKSRTRLSALSHPRDPATYTTKTKHPPMTLAPLFQSLPGGNSGTCPQRSQTTYIRFCYVPYITLSCPKEDIFA